MRFFGAFLWLLLAFTSFDASANSCVVQHLETALKRQESDIGPSAGGGTQGPGAGGARASTTVDIDDAIENFGDLSRQFEGVETLPESGTAADWLNARKQLEEVSAEAKDQLKELEDLLATARQQVSQGNGREWGPKISPLRAEIEKARTIVARSDELISDAIVAARRNEVQDHLFSPGWKPSTRPAYDVKANVTGRPTDSFDTTPARSSREINLTLMNNAGQPEVVRIPEGSPVRNAVNPTGDVNGLVYRLPDGREVRVMKPTDVRDRHPETWYQNGYVRISSPGVPEHQYVPGSFGSRQPASGGANGIRGPPAEYTEIADGYANDFTHFHIVPD